MLKFLVCLAMLSLLNACERPGVDEAKKAMAKCKVDGAKNFPEGAKIWASYASLNNGDAVAYENFVENCMVGAGYTFDINSDECQPDNVVTWREPMEFKGACYKGADILSNIIYNLFLFIQKKREATLIRQ